MTDQSHTPEHPAVANLREHQTQLDADGCMVGVSRQALDETLALYGEVLDALNLILPLAKGYRPDGQTAAARTTCNSWIEAADAAIAKAAGSECERCNGRGEIGGPVGQTAETFEWVTEPCPDCAKATGEAGQG